MKLLGKIQSIKQLNADTFLLNIKSKEIAESAKAGQFVNIKCCNGLDAFLRRPISICSINQNESTFDIAYQVRGRGTEFLSRTKPGDELDLLAPLGRGFTLNPEHENIVVVGGGIGVFPLLQVLRAHPAPFKTAILGFRNSENVVMEDEFKKYSNELIIATDDGSYGEKGFVTSILEKRLEFEKYSMAYICGPTIMMKSAVEILKKREIPCEVSMEQRMGCGIGACLVCACKTKSGDDWDYSHVCKDGPVFNGYEVIFD